MDDIEEYRFVITIFTQITNNFRTNNKDAALHKIESMVGKISFKFTDKETKYEIEINDYKDYQTLLENYEVKDNESRFIQKKVVGSKDISR